MEPVALINLVNLAFSAVLEAWAKYARVRDEWRRLNPSEEPPGGWPSDADEIAALRADSATLLARAAELKQKYGPDGDGTPA